MRGIDPKLFHKMTENWIHQICSCICSREGHLNKCIEMRNKLCCNLIFSLIYLH